MAGVGVVALLARLVAATETDQVGRDHPVAGLDEHWDHVPVEKTPRRLTMHQQHRRSIGWALIEVVDPQRLAVTRVDLEVVRIEVEIGQARETVIWGSEHLHEFSSGMSMVVRSSATTTRPGNTRLAIAATSSPCPGG